MDTDEDRIIPTATCIKLCQSCDYFIETKSFSSLGNRLEMNTCLVKWSTLSFDLFLDQFSIRCAKT